MTNKEKFVLDELSKESPMVISTAYIYAKNYVKYGCDITKAWSTAVEQAAILERVKTDAQYEAYNSLKKDYETELKSDMEAVLDKIRAEIRKWYWQADKQELAKDPCVVDAMVDLFIRTIAKYQALYCNPLKTNEEEEDG